MGIAQKRCEQQNQQGAGVGSEGKGKHSLFSPSHPPRCTPVPEQQEQQRAKKVVSDSPGLVDFAIGLVNSVFNLPDGQVKNRRTVKSILLVKKFLGPLK